MSLSLPFIEAGVVEDMVELQNLGLDEESLLLSAMDSKMIFDEEDLKKLKKKGFSKAFIGKLRTHTESLKQKAQGPLLMVETMGDKEPVTVKFHSHQSGAILLLDGKVVDQFQETTLSHQSTPGWHEIALQWEGGEFSREVRFIEGEVNVFHLFSKVELSEEDQKLAQRFIQELHAKEVKAFTKRDFSRPIKNRFDQVVGREFFRSVRVTPSHGLRTLDTTHLLLNFEGYQQVQTDNQPLVSPSKLVVFFTLEIDPTGKIVHQDVKQPRVHQQYLDIVKEVEVLNENYQTIRSYNASEKEPNLRVITSPSALKKTLSFQLSLPHSDAIYTLGPGTWSICPLDRPYQSLWERKGLDVKSELSLKAEQKVVVILHSNLLGDKSQVHHVSDNIELKALNYNNFKEKLSL